MGCSTCLAAQPFDPVAEYADFQAGIMDEGAIVSFLGVARPKSTGGEDVAGLFLQHHPRLTAASLEEIAADAGRRFDISSIRIVHRCGDIRPGEALVFVAAASPHRRAAFDAADYAMDRLKTEAVFWKREDGVDGSRWIEPTPGDQADRARWSK